MMCVSVLLYVISFPFSFTTLTYETDHLVVFLNLSISFPYLYIICQGSLSKLKKKKMKIWLMHWISYLKLCIFQSSQQLFPCISLLLPTSLLIKLIITNSTVVKRVLLLSLLSSPLPTPNLWIEVSNPMIVHSSMVNDHSENSFQSHHHRVLKKLTQGA